MSGVETRDDAGYVPSGGGLLVRLLGGGVEGAGVRVTA
ncbi:MAG: hypothetical protein AVDCRST_MAG01-01-2202 [uncultured Rubrobacteraceae bacterium]|uniref:Uncharacterized protein n=1 Tax=uncultured Rubrobacteraceae bacterium TaxID=349277 RepID=A0A6J4PRV2_9ACTN|nr:MAG: hypothetical protein AVDCRST_MAG01-01-2202 [uncultured Rubrobacteraceae bacterium]